MERVGIRELRQNASRYIGRVKAGETVEVTERGRLVALLVPPDPSAGRRELLIAEGSLIPAGRPFRLPERVVLSPGSPTSEAVLRDLREDRV